jgi:hypothetical protein
MFFFSFCSSSSPKTASASSAAMLPLAAAKTNVLLRVAPGSQEEMLSIAF